MLADISTFLSLDQTTETTKSSVSCFNAQTTRLSTTKTRQLARLLTNAKSDAGSGATLDDILADYTVYKADQRRKAENGGAGSEWFSKIKKPLGWTLGAGALAGLTGSLAWLGRKAYQRWRGRDPEEGLVPAVMSDVSAAYDRTMRGLFGENYKKKTESAAQDEATEPDVDWDGLNQPIGE